MYRLCSGMDSYYSGVNFWGQDTILPAYMTIESRKCVKTNFLNFLFSSKPFPSIPNIPHTLEFDPLWLLHFSVLLLLSLHS